MYLDKPGFFSLFFILPANGFPGFLSLGKFLEFRGKILEFRIKILEFRVKILSLKRKKNVEIVCFYLIFLKIAGFFSLAIDFA